MKLPNFVADFFDKYATNKSRAQLGHSDQQWEQRVIVELDSALNKWADDLPSHRELCVSSYGMPIAHGQVGDHYSAMESGTGEHAVSEPGSDNRRFLLPTSNRGPPTVHVFLSPRIADFACIHHHLHERCPSSYSGDRSLIHANGKANAQEHGKSAVGCCHPARFNQMR